MTQTTDHIDVPPMGLAARIGNVFVAPRAAYTAVAARPTAFGVLLVIILVMAAAQYVFLSTEVGRNATMNQQIDAMKAFGMTVTDQMVQQLQNRMGIAKYTGPVSIAVLMPLVAAVVSGLVLMVFTAILGGGATYRQVFAVVAHSQVIMALATLFTLPIAYAREEMVSPTRLAVFFPMLDDKGFVYYLLSAIDLFYIWVVVNLAIGIAVLYKRRTAPIASVLLGIYAVVAIIIAVWRAS